jgi:ABC-type phosphate transport system auxiliary subunit
MDAQVVSSAVAVVGTLGGALIGALSQREAKKISMLERRLERYRNEIRARQAEEEAAARWLFSLNASTSELAAKRELRRRTEVESGLRPFIGPKEMGHNS